jgi:hypothetical protein
VEGDGRVVAYASVVDNATGDAVFVPALRPSPTEGLVMPVVARTAGFAGTEWASELRITNFGDTAADVAVEFIPGRGSAGVRASAQRTILPGAVLAFDDVLMELFGLIQAVGSLRLTCLDRASSFGVTARIYNSGHDGSYGQFVAAAGTGSDGRAAVIHADDSASTRTNLGVCEVAGGTVVVAVTVRDSVGRPMGEPLVVDLEPYQLIQVNDVFAAVGQGPASNTWVELEKVGGSGRFVGYGSMVDARTGDAIFVPSRPLPEPEPPLALLGR